MEFHLGHGDMIRLLRGCGFEIEDLHETRPEPGATSEPGNMQFRSGQRRSHQGGAIKSG